MKNIISTLLMISSVLVLTACGDGGGSGGGEVESLKTSTFSVSVSDINMRRISNGDAVFVDITGISSGDMTLIK